MKRAHNVDRIQPEALKILKKAAQLASFRYRGLEEGDYLSIGWLETVRNARVVSPHMFFWCLQSMRRYWATEWAKHKNECTCSDWLEDLEIGVEDHPLTNLMAQEYMEMLNPTDRRLVFLRLWQNMTWREISWQFDMTKEGVRQRYLRIIESLRKKAQ